MLWRVLLFKTGGTFALLFFITSSGNCIQDRSKMYLGGGGGGGGFSSSSGCTIASIQQVGIIPKGLNGGGYLASLAMQATRLWDGGSFCHTQFTDVVMVVLHSTLSILGAGREGRRWLALQGSRYAFCSTTSPPLPCAFASGSPARPFLSPGRDSNWSMSPVQKPDPPPPSPPPPPPLGHP